ncbi:MAG: type II toxin-antitoxin system VapC family toxin [Pseudomonadota bacterium]
MVDCSVSLAWHFEDEVSPTAELVLEWILNRGAIVPSHWKAEVANGLLFGVRRGRMSLNRRASVLLQLEALGMSVDSESETHVWSETLALADAHNLTIYDAIYLELAKRKSLPLATLDKNLSRAAHEAGVQVFKAVA